MRNWWRKYKHRKAIELVRREMALSGCPLFHLRDEEVEERMQIVGEAMCASVITTQQWILLLQNNKTRPSMI